MVLKGKTALVTGAAKRIGREIALEFARRGANLLIHYHHSQKEAESLAQAIRRMKVRCELFRANLFDQTETKKMAQTILRKVGGVDVLVNNASVYYETPFESVQERDWDSFLAVHVKAPFFLAQALAPHMKKRKSGRIINIADWSGLRPYRDYLPYCVSKGALLTMTEALAKTLAPEVLVTAVCPGPVMPPPGLSAKSKSAVAKVAPVGRWGDPKDIARMVVFLAEQDFVTGSYHLVDGGRLLKG